MKFLSKDIQLIKKMKYRALSAFPLKKSAYGLVNGAFTSKAVRLIPSRVQPKTQNVGIHKCSYLKFINERA